MTFKAHKAFWHKSGGYTLIELMIIIVVIALLVALAVPAYKNYTVRSKITECINGASVAKLHISEYRQIMGPWPPSLTDAGLPPAVSGVSQFCSGFVGYASGDGSFRVDIDEAAIGVFSGIVEPVLMPNQLPNGIVDWNCGTGNTSSANVRLLPASCRDS